MTPKFWLHIGTECLEANKFRPVQNIPYFTKPSGGLWAAPLRLNDEWMSDWHEYRGAGGNAVIFTLNQNARIYTIDSYEDLLALLEEAGAQQKESLFFDSTMVHLDYENISKIYDVIFLTHKGEQETRFSFNSSINLNLYGWDVESCFIFNFGIIESQMSVKLMVNEPAW